MCKSGALESEGPRPHLATTRSRCPIRIRKGAITERAELIFERSVELTRTASTDVARAAIDLSRAADHDEATLRHAAGIGRARNKCTPHDQSTMRGAQLLEDIIAFLGFSNRRGDGRTSGPRRNRAAS